jgi:hypothetical protein
MISIYIVLLVLDIFVSTQWVNDTYKCCRGSEWSPTTDLTRVGVHTLFFVGDFEQDVIHMDNHSSWAALSLMFFGTRRSLAS